MALAGFSRAAAHGRTTCSWIRGEAPVLLVLISAPQTELPFPTLPLAQIPPVICSCCGAGCVMDSVLVLAAWLHQKEK